VTNKQKLESLGSARACGRLIPHDVIADNITLEWLAEQFVVS